MTEVTVTLSGIVIAAPNTRGTTTSGTDLGNHFGGGSLIGDTFTSTWTGDYSIGGYGTVYDATLTINGYTFDFGTDLNHTYDMFRDDNLAGPGPYNVVLYQLMTNSGNQLAVDPGQGGLVFISIDNLASHNTQAYLDPFPVPAPILGTGFPAFIILIWLAYRHLRRWGVYAPLSSPRSTK